MVRFDYLVKGLNALSRAHRVNTMAGHLGAAVVAGYFIAEQHPLLDDKVYAGIEGELERIIRGESVFSPKKGATITVAGLFEPHPKERPKPELVDDIAKTLAGNIDSTRESGHNVIFAAIAIRALKDHPDLATPAVLGGVCELIAGFNEAKPGSGYYGKERGRIDGRKVPLPQEDTFRPYTSLSAMAEAVLDELLRSAGQRREGYGGLWHVINHAAALAELAAYGYHELATSGLPAHYQHMRLFRTVPDVSDERGKQTPTDFDPHAPEFWTAEQIRRDRALLDHRIKTLYGFTALVNLVSSEVKRNQTREKLRYLM